jgi:arylsulfatase A
VRWPGVVAAGRVSSALISQIDLMATMSEIVGFELPADSADDSHSLLSVFKGGTVSPRVSHVHNTNKDHYAIRDGNWVLIDAPSGAVSRVPDWFDEANGYEKNKEAGELYDLSTDLSERHNLFARHPQKVRELRDRLAAIRARGEVR